MGWKIQDLNTIKFKITRLVAAIRSLRFALLALIWLLTTCLINGYSVPSLHKNQLVSTDHQLKLYHTFELNFVWNTCIFIQEISWNVFHGLCRGQWVEVSLEINHQDFMNYCNYSSLFFIQNVVMTLLSFLVPFKVLFMMFEFHKITCGITCGKSVWMLNDYGVLSLVSTNSSLGFDWFISLLYFLNIKLICL